MVRASARSATAATPSTTTATGSPTTRRSTARAVMCNEATRRRRRVLAAAGPGPDADRLARRQAHRGLPQRKAQLQGRRVAVLRGRASRRAAADSCDVADDDANCNGVRSEGCDVHQRQRAPVRGRHRQLQAGHADLRRRQVVERVRGCGGAGQPPTPAMPATTPTVTACPTRAAPVSMAPPAPAARPCRARATASTSRSPAPTASGRSRPVRKTVPTVPPAPVPTASASTSAAAIAAPATRASRSAPTARRAARSTCVATSSVRPTAAVSTVAAPASQASRRAPAAAASTPAPTRTVDPAVAVARAVGLGGAHDFAEVLALHVSRELKRLANVRLEQHQRIPAMPLVIPDDEDRMPHVGDQVRMVSIPGQEQRVRSRRGPS